MSFLSSPSDDTPSLQDGEFWILLARLYRERDWTHANAGNVGRMFEARHAEDPSYTPAVVRMTLASARNAAEALLRTYDAIEAEVLPVPSVPVIKPFGRRRSLDAALPAVVSPGALA